MDKRKHNGGHSTRSRGIDKRKNEYKEVLNDALNEDELKKVVRMLYGKAVNDEDTNAAKILIEHYLGKPKQTIDQNNTNYDIVWNEEKTYE